MLTEVEDTKEERPGSTYMWMIWSGCRTNGGPTSIMPVRPSTWVWRVHLEYRSCVVQSIVGLISKVTYKPSVCIWCWAPPLKHPPSIWHKISIHTIRVHRPLLFHYFFLLQCNTNKQNHWRTGNKAISVPVLYLNFALPYLGQPVQHLGHKTLPK